MENLTPLIASFLLYISQEESPHDAVELAVIDTEKNLEKYDFKVSCAKRAIYSYLHPEIDKRIKIAAGALFHGCLNFDVLKKGELEEINLYMDKIEEYFKS